MSCFHNSLMVLTWIKYIVILIQLITIPIVIHKVFNNLTATLVVAFINFIITIPVIVGDRMFFAQMKQLNKQINLLTSENERYESLNNKMTNKINLLEESNIKYRKLNKEFSNNIQNIRDECTALKMANKKLIIIQQQSQDLLNNLMSAGDEFKEFGDILNTAVNKNLSLTEKLNLLLNNLSKAKFSEMDKNNDGIISGHEFRNYFN